MRNKEVIELFKFHKFSQNISGNIDMNIKMNEFVMSSPHYLPL